MIFYNLLFTNATLLDVLRNYLLNSHFGLLKIAKLKWFISDTLNQSFSLSK